MAEGGPVRSAKSEARSARRWTLGLVAGLLLGVAGLLFLGAGVSSNRSTLDRGPEGTAALASVSDSGVGRLVGIIADIGLAPLRGRESAVLDLDSSVIVSYGHHEGAVFGYNGKGRNRRRHHPLVASVAETRTVVHADYRDGSAIKAVEAISFIGRAVTVLRASLASGANVILRADAGFWSKAMGSWTPASRSSSRCPFTPGSS